MNAIEKTRWLFYKEIFEELYSLYNRHELISPDPLQFVYEYEDPADREIVGLIASSLALGRVEQILKSVSLVLKRMKPSPSKFLKDVNLNDLRRSYRDFKHRFINGNELFLLLFGIKDVISRFGSLEACFKKGLQEKDATVFSALGNFIKELESGSDVANSRLLPSHDCKSACKRLNLFLRWMVRKDSVDPGVWSGISPERLVVPLDTHMHRFCMLFGFVKRKQKDQKTALEATAAFRQLSPKDPVKYDFALTRLGIRDELDIRPFFEKILKEGVIDGKENLSSKRMSKNDMQILM